MADIHLLVAPETLRQTSEAMEDLLRKVRSHARRIGEISARTRGHWRGDAGERDREGFVVCRDELLSAAADLEERARSLLRLAGVYQETEETVQEGNVRLEAAQVSRKEAGPQ